MGEVGVDALVLLFQRNGERENLPLRQAVKVLHDRSSP